MLSQKRAEIIDFSTKLTEEFFPKYLYIIETKYDYNYQVKLELIDIEKVFNRAIKIIEFENFSELQFKMLFDILDQNFNNFEKRTWTKFNYLTNMFSENESIEVPAEINFIKEDAFLKLVQDKIEEKRNQISLNYIGLKNHFLISFKEQGKKNKNKKEKKEKNVVFDLLDNIRESDYSKLDLRKKLKKETDFDIENLQYLLKDIDLYLFIEKEEFECNFTSDEISEKLKQFEEKGYTTERLISLGYLEEFKAPEIKKDGVIVDLGIKDSIYVNKEKLLFPFEFYSVYEFKNMVIYEINKLKKINNKTDDVSKINKKLKLKVNMSVGELSLIFKLINDLKPNLFEVKSEAELHRFISSNFETKKTGDNDISTTKLRILFNQPEFKAAEFWEEKLRLMLADVKKIK